MHCMILARMAGIEYFSILVVVVRHGVEKCRAPAAACRSDKGVGGPIVGVGERNEGAKL